MLNCASFVVSLGMGPSICSLLRLRFVSLWDSEKEGLVRIGLLPLRMTAGPIQHFSNDIFTARHFFLSLHRASAKVFGKGLHVTFCCRNRYLPGVTWEKVIKCF